MIALLCSAQFRVGDDAPPIYVELRRHHDIKDLNGCDNKAFIVAKRFPPMHGCQSGQMFTKSFGTPAEGKREWDLQKRMLEDQGLKCVETVILGFHEEG